MISLGFEFTSLSKRTNRILVKAQGRDQARENLSDKAVHWLSSLGEVCFQPMTTPSIFVSEKSESFTTRQDFLQTSVPRNSMEQRISRLGQFINEAQWRFQLVSWKNASKGQTTRNSKKRLSRKIKQIVRTDEKSKEEDAEDEDSDDVDGATSKGFLIFCFLILM